MRKLGSILMVVVASVSIAAAEDDRGYLGVTLAGFQNVEGPRENGVYVVDMKEGSGATAAGLEPDDKIVAIDGNAIATLDDIDAALEGTRPGDKVGVTVRRDGRERTYDVVLNRRETGYAVGAGAGRRWAYVVDEERASLAADTQTLTEQLAEFFGVESGALVTSVHEDGASWRAGVRAGDVITGWNESSISSFEDLRAKLSEAEPGDVVDLQIRRRDRRESIPVRLEEAKSLGFSMSIDVLPEGGSR